LTIYGKEGESEEKPLVHSQTHRNKFEKNHKDRFVIETNDLGDPLIGIKIRHDSTGIMPEWHLDRVEIVDERRHRMFIFPCQKWFSKHIGDKKIERVVKEINYQPIDKNVRRKAQSAKTIRRNLRTNRLPEEYSLRKLLKF
jgi:hypothetical protein